MHLVIGAHGLIGTALCKELGAHNIAYMATTRRRSDDGSKMVPFDLLKADTMPLPAAEVIYLVAAMAGFAACEGSAESHRVNVDAPIALARRYRKSFVVYISSDAVEWCGGTAYARQRADVESYIQAIDGGIVRASRVAPNRADELANFIIGVAETRKVGLTRWE